MLNKKGFNMTAAEAAKKAGFKSLKEVSQLSGVNVDKLGRWHKESPQLFKTVLLGAWHLKINQNIL